MFHSIDPADPKWKIQHGESSIGFKQLYYLRA